MLKKIKRVAITGGTHGNELTGVYLVKKFKADPECIKRGSFETVVMHTNKKAIQKCTRYIDKDLNRMFNTENLHQPDKGSYEEINAKLLNRILGPKGKDETHVDFIVDLHSTTANMGLTVVVDSENELAWQVAAYLKEKVPKLTIFRWRGDTGNAPFLHTVAREEGFAIEVGPISHGTLRADLFLETEKLVHHILDFFEKYNNRDIQKKYENIEIYDSLELVDFPRDAQGGIDAMIHPELQGKEYTPLKKGSPLFLTFDGRTIPYEKDEVLYPVFINEAAYYEKEVALCLSQKKIIAL